MGTAKQRTYRRLDIFPRLNELSRPVQGELLEVTSPATNRLDHSRPTPIQTDPEVYLPVHRGRRPVAVVQLQDEVPLGGGHRQDVVDRAALLRELDIVGL